MVFNFCHFEKVWNTFLNLMNMWACNFHPRTPRRQNQHIWPGSQKRTCLIFPFIDHQQNQFFWIVFQVNDWAWHNVMNLQISEGLIFASFAKCHKIQYIMDAPPPTWTALFLIIMETFARAPISMKLLFHSKNISVTPWPISMLIFHVNTTG